MKKRYLTVLILLMLPLELLTIFHYEGLSLTESLIGFAVLVLFLITLGYPVYRSLMSAFAINTLINCHKRMSQKREFDKAAFDRACNILGNDREIRQLSACEYGDDLARKVGDTLPRLTREASSGVRRSRLVFFGVLIATMAIKLLHYFLNRQL